MYSGNDKNSFSEGVEPGGLRSKQDVKILICYMFDKIGQMRKQDALSALQEKGLVNYFVAGEAFSELLSGNNIKFDEASGKYAVSDSGKLISEQLSGSLPKSVRENAIICCENTLQRIKNEEENRAKIEKNDFGYNVSCSISGGDFDLLKFSIYVPDMQQAENVKNNFRNDPEGLYHAVLSVLTRKKEIGDRLKDMLSDLTK